MSSTDQITPLERTVTLNNDAGVGNINLGAYSFGSVPVTVQSSIEISNFSIGQHLTRAYDPLLVQDTLYNRYDVDSITYGEGVNAHMLYVHKHGGAVVPHTFTNAVEAQREFRLIAVMMLGR
jgi:hypothetical protein